MINRFCERCERVTADGNLWCQDRDCPAEAGHPVLVYGDFLGDLKVTKLLRVWRTAALYEALRGETPVLLKVAHESEDCEERIKREALALESLAPRAGGAFSSVRSAPRPVLPVPVSPYPVPSKRPYGEISFRGETKFYTVYQHAAGKFLRDLLLENPQIWHYHAAWIVITVSEALRPLAVRNKCHLTLTPDIILVDVDSEGIPRPLLVDLGFLVEGQEIQSLYDWSRLAEPAYTAPELLAGRAVKAVTPAADVYSLGTIFHEMLAGRPAFEASLRRDDQIRQAVMQFRGSPAVGRPELEAAGVVKIVERAVAPADRYANVAELGKALAAIYGRPPKEKRPRPRRFYVLLIVLALIFLIVGGIALYIIISLMQRLPA